MAASLSARTLFLKLHPSARTFAERREVLRVMERFGEVTMFKSYKYNPRNPTPNTFLVLFAAESAAQDALNACPLRYRLISNSSSSAPSLDYTEQASPPTNPSPPSTAASHFSSSSPLDPLNESSNEAQPPSGPSPELQEHPYQLHAYPAYFSHDLYFQSPLHNPLHGPYTPVPPKLSYIASSLSQNVPSSIMTPGLLDWETDSRFGRRGLDSDSPTPSKTAGTMEGDIDESSAVALRGDGGEDKAKNVEVYFQRRQNRRAEKSTPQVMRGLRRLWQERGLQASAEGK